MTRKVDTMIWRHWAIKSKSGGRLLRDLKGHVAIWTHRYGAEEDCPTYGRIIRVAVKEIRNERKSKYR